MTLRKRAESIPELWIGSSEIPGVLTDMIESALRETRREALEEAAALHESIDPASDMERLDRIQGCGAGAAVIEYRHAIRTLMEAKAGN